MCAEIGNDTVDARAVVVLSELGTGECSSEILAEGVTSILLGCGTRLRTVNVGLVCCGGTENGCLLCCRRFGRLASLGACEWSEFGSSVVVGGDSHESGSRGFIAFQSRTSSLGTVCSSSSSRSIGILDLIVSDFVLNSLNAYLP